MTHNDDDLEARGERWRTSALEPQRWHPSGLPLWAKASEQLTDLNALMRQRDWESTLAHALVASTFGWRFDAVHPGWDAATTLCTASTPRGPYSFLVLWSPSPVDERWQPEPGAWIEWLGLKHVTGNVFQAAGWMPAWCGTEAAEAAVWREKPAPTDTDNTSTKGTPS